MLGTHYQWLYTYDEMTPHIQEEKKAKEHFINTAQEKHLWIHYGNPGLFWTPTGFLQWLEERTERYLIPDSYFTYINPEIKLKEVTRRLQETQEDFTFFTHLFDEGFENTL